MDKSNVFEIELFGESARYSTRYSRKNFEKIYRSYEIARDEFIPEESEEYPDFLDSFDAWIDHHGHQIEKLLYVPAYDE